MAEAVGKEIDTGGAKQTFKELFAGAAGGVAQVLIGELVLCLMFGVGVLMVFSLEISFFECVGA